MLYKCNECGFLTPDDFIGAALMKEHLKECSKKRGGSMQYTSDQLESLIDWLEYQRDAGLTLEEVINGLVDGTFTTADKHNLSFT